MTDDIVGWICLIGGGLILSGWASTSAITLTASCGLGAVHRTYLICRGEMKSPGLRRPGLNGRKAGQAVARAGLSAAGRPPGCFDRSKSLPNLRSVPSSGSCSFSKQPPSFPDVVLRQHKRDFIFFEQCRHIQDLP
jgi:hypothetical protein